MDHTSFSNNPIDWDAFLSIDWTDGVALDDSTVAAASHEGAATAGRILEQSCRGGSVFISLSNTAKNNFQGDTGSSNVVPSFREGLEGPRALGNAPFAGLPSVHPPLTHARAFARFQGPFAFGGTAFGQFPTSVSDGTQSTAASRNNALSTFGNATDDSSAYGDIDLNDSVGGFFSRLPDSGCRMNAVASPGDVTTAHSQHNGTALNAGVGHQSHGLSFSAAPKPTAMPASAVQVVGPATTGPPAPQSQPIICNSPDDIPSGRQLAAVLKCGMCTSTKLFARHYEMKRHMDTHSPGQYPCTEPGCRYTGSTSAFKRPEHLRNHLRKVHGI